MSVFDTSAGGLLLPEGFIHAVASASALTWFIRYIYYRNIQYLNNIIINKTKILYHQAEVTLAAFGYPGAETMTLGRMIPSRTNIQPADVPTSW
jgi:hypothetical protein